MRSFKRVLLAALAAIMLFSLCACGLPFGDMSETMQKLVQGNLDEIYLGVYSEEFMKLVNATEAECEQIYQESLEAEAEFFGRYFNVEYMTDEIEQEIIELYKEIYAYSNFTVGEASKLDDNTYAVKLTVAPINIVELVDENWDMGMAAFYEKYAEADLEAMTEEEYMEFDADWTRAIIQMFYDNMDDISYNEEEAMAVQVVKDSDGLWVISDSDMSKIDALIIYYP